MSDKLIQASSTPTCRAIYELFMLRIGSNEHLHYCASSLDDLYIVLKVEHDGVFDVALVDIMTGIVDLRVYDAYKFIIAERLKMTVEVFDNLISDMNTYFDNVISMIAAAKLKKEESNASK